MENVCRTIIGLHILSFVMVFVIGPVVMNFLTKENFRFDV